MILENAIASAQQEIPGCVALGLIDLSTGTVLCGSPLERGGFDLAAAACGELLWADAPEAYTRGRPATDDTGRPGFATARAQFREALVVGQDRVHVFFRSRSRASCAYVAVCASTVGLGLVLAKVRASLGAIDSGE